LSAEFFVRAIDESIEWVRTTGKYASAQEREQVIGLFQAGQAAYRRLL
jgi:hypothetical protein